MNSLSPTVIDIGADVSCEGVVAAKHLGTLVVVVIQKGDDYYNESSIVCRCNFF